MYWLDWCSDVCSSDLARAVYRDARRRQRPDVREPHPLRAGCDNEALDDPASGARGLLDVESSVWVADPHGLPLTPRDEREREQRRTWTRTRVIEREARRRASRPQRMERVRPQQGGLRAALRGTQAPEVEELEVVQARDERRRAGEALRLRQDDAPVV